MLLTVLTVLDISKGSGYMTDSKGELSMDFYPLKPPSPKFARRHYQWIASDIREQMFGQDIEGHRALVALAERMADSFAQDNPLFRRQTFLAECGASP